MVWVKSNVKLSLSCTISTATTSIGQVYISPWKNFPRCMVANTSLVQRAKMGGCEKMRLKTSGFTASLVFSGHFFK
jgi:hypothetical protein